MDRFSHTGHTHQRIVVMWKWCWKLLAFQRDCLSSREPWCSKSVFMAGDSMGFFFLFFIFYKRQASFGLPFLLMSCHAMAFQGGNMFLCRRQSRQAGGDKGSSNQIRHVIKSSERPELARSSEKQRRKKRFHKEQSGRLTPGRTDRCTLRWHWSNRALSRFWSADKQCGRWSCLCSWSDTLSVFTLKKKISSLKYNSVSAMD